MDDSTDKSKTPADYAREGQEFIAEIHAKMNKLVEEFSQGLINRTQFHQLYERYQKRIMSVAQLIVEDDPATWREAVEGTEETIVIKQRLMAKALGMAIYDNNSGMPIETLGNFNVEPELLVPMLSSYQSAASEIFRAGMRSTAMDNGNWLCFVPGALTTLVALFSLEPSPNQLETIERLHRDFERANAQALEQGNVDPEMLAYPFLSFIQRGSRR
jgi:hypothetical protein